VSVHAPAANLQLLDREAWLEERLLSHGISPRLLQGDTTIEIRKQRAREAIAKVGTSVIGGVKDKKPLTYAQCFQLVYGEPL
jgi:hypothetical protein